MNFKQIGSNLLIGAALISSLNVAPAHAGEFCLDLWNEDCDLVPDSRIPEPNDVVDAIDDGIDAIQAETDMTVINRSRYFINVRMENEDNGNIQEFGLMPGKSYTFNSIPQGNYLFSAQTPNGQNKWAAKHFYTLSQTSSYTFN